MNDVNSERRRLLPLSEDDNGDPGELYAVPAAAQSGLSDACATKWVNILSACGGPAIEIDES